MTDKPRLVAFYLRVSTDEQREARTIDNQHHTLRRVFARDVDAPLVEVFADDGISGTIPLGERPAGRRLLAAARAGLITEVWVVRADRLGRDAADMLSLWKVFKELGVKLVGVEESIESYLAYGIQALFADDEREKFLARSAAGMNRAAREGRYTGGIVPLGYRTEGIRPNARLAISETVIWGDWTEADLVRRIYHWLAMDGWSCVRIAAELNALGVPTVYQRDGRGIRGKKTQGKWRAGRIRNLVVNPVYKGELWYGRRSKRSREAIQAPVDAIVSVEMWDAAQAALQTNRLMPKNTTRSYLLRSLITCGMCGLRYCGTWNQRGVWYRCNGRLTDRGPLEGRCKNKMLKGDHLDRLVWADIERFLRNPGDLIDELLAERNGDPLAAVIEAERTTLEAQLDSLARQRDLTLDLYTQEHISRDELDERLGGLTSSQAEIRKRLAALEPNEPTANDALSEDLLEELRRALDEGMDDAKRQQIASTLVERIVVRLQEAEGRKQVSVTVEYRFSLAVDTDSDTGSWPPSA